MRYQKHRICIYSLTMNESKSTQFQSNKFNLSNSQAPQARQMFDDEIAFPLTDDTSFLLLLIFFFIS